MSDTTTDPLDAWFDEARATLQPPESPLPSWPAPETLPRQAALVLPSVGATLHVLAVLVAVVVTLTGRVDPALAGMTVLVGGLSLAPRLAAERMSNILSRDVAGRLRALALSHEFNGRSWAIAAWILAALCLAAGVASMQAHSLLADAQTPYWRHAWLRWAGLALATGGLTGLCARHMLRSRQAQQDAAGLEEELQLEGAADGKSWQRHSGARLLAGIMAFSLAAATAAVAGPENRDDSPGRVWVLGENAEARASWLRAEFNFHTQGLSLDEAWSLADARFHGERGQLETLTHLADLEGIGFLLVPVEALGLDPTDNVEFQLTRSVGAAPEFACIATGDASVLEYAAGWGATGRSRPTWVPLDLQAVSLGGSEAWVQGEAAYRLALVRALFAQPAFHFPDFDHPENPPEFNGDSSTLLRGILYFDLHPDFWSRATGIYSGIEEGTAEGQVDPRLEN